MKLVLWMLFSGFVHFPSAANHLRHFKFHDKGRFEDSLKICQENHGSLVTLHDEGDADFLSDYLEDKRVFSAWLGLERKQGNLTTFSTNTSCSFDWTNVTKGPREQICGAIVNNQLRDFNCSDSFVFMCSNGHLINASKNWCEARQYCRRHFTLDLISICDYEHNQQEVEHGGKTFWVGLMYDEWEWVDKSCSTYRTWGTFHDKSSQRCTSMSQGRFSVVPCGNGQDTLCYTGKFRIVVITNKSTWDDAMKYCEENHSGLLMIEGENDQSAVAERMKKTEVSGPFWIGLRQSRVFGFWSWNGRVGSINHWENGQEPQMPLSENCGVFNEQNDKWKDENCERKLPFLCEHEIPLMN